MEYWLNVGFLEIDQLVDVAVAAEALGFAGLSFPDHLFFPDTIESKYPYSNDGSLTFPVDAPWPDCWTSIAVLANATTRLRFTTSIFIAPLRDPFTLAKAVGTAAGFGPGRVSLGVGTGWMKEEFDVVGHSFKGRGSRLDEMIEVLRLLWTGERVEFHGSHYDFDPVIMRPAAQVPLWVGGNSAPALRRAATAQGWIGAHTALDDTAAALHALHDERASLDSQNEEYEILLTALPRDVKDATQLEALGVNGLILAALALSGGSPDVVAGMQRFAERVGL